MAQGSAPERCPSAQNQQVTEQGIIRKQQLECLLEMAKNDDNFMMVCLLFDEQVETEFGVFAGVYLDQCKMEKTEATELMKEVLLYAHWKRFGIIDRQEQELRERRLRSTMKLFEAARATVGKRRTARCNGILTSSKMTFQYSAVGNFIRTQAELLKGTQLCVEINTQLCTLG